jgi:serine/threonine-protein kinase
MWKTASEQEIRARVLAGDLPMPESIRADVPAPLARICRRALSRSPADRHATAQQLADELEAAMGELGLAATHKAIGAAVARLFADVRAETKRAIETKLGRASMSMPLTAVTGTGETPTGRTPAAVARRYRFVIGAAVAATMIVALAFAARRKGGETAPASAVAPAASSQATATPAAAAPAAKERTNLTATSPDATTLPDEGTSATADAPKPPRTGAGGAAKPATRRPAGHVLGMPVNPPPVVVPAPAAGGAPARAPAADCAHPFFVDSDGIKKFRPECM